LNGGFEKGIFLFLATPLPAACGGGGAASLVFRQEDGEQALQKERRVNFGLAVRPSQPKRLLWRSRQGKEIRVSRKTVAVPIIHVNWRKRFGR
jgi:hypothetical protein